MYISYDEYLNSRLISSEPMSEEEYMRIAPIADAVIDDWTLERVGKAAKNGELLPEIVMTVYASVCDNVPGIISGSTVENGGTLSAFSNGVDSFSFDVSLSMSEKIKNSMGWIVELLPIEWCSSCVAFDGGNKYAS